MDLEHLKKFMIIEEPKLNKVQLFKLTHRLNLNADAVIGVLNNSGYSLLKNKYNFVLDENQLEIISNAYSNSVKDLFRKTKKTVSTLRKRQKINLYNFFRLFISNSEKYNPDSIYSGELETNLIKKYFFSTAASVNYIFQNESTQNYIPINIKIIKNYIEIHIKIISTFIRYHCKKLCIDEDSIRGKSICFS
jgi:hypothetical protein